MGLYPKKLSGFLSDDDMKQVYNDLCNSANSGSYRQDVLDGVSFDEMKIKATQSHYFSHKGISCHCSPTFDEDGQQKGFDVLETTTGRLRGSKTFTEMDKHEFDSIMKNSVCHDLFTVQHSGSTVILEGKVGLSNNGESLVDPMDKRVLPYTLQMADIYKRTPMVSSVDVKTNSIVDVQQTTIDGETKSGKKQESLIRVNGEDTLCVDTVVNNTSINRIVAKNGSVNMNALAESNRKVAYNMSKQSDVSAIIRTGDIAKFMSETSTVEPSSQSYSLE